MPPPPNYPNSFWAPCPMKQTVSAARASYSDFAEGYFLTRASMEWFFELYPARPRTSTTRT